MPTTPPTLYLIRHGQASAGFDQAYDPGLDAIGLAQAEAIANELEALGPLPLVTSPLQRTRQTAAAFEKRWKVQARIEPAVAEIPSPTKDLQARTDWLRQAMRGRWSELAPQYQEWRDQVVVALVALKTTTVVTSHFIAINVAVCAATQDDRVICFEPDNCSCTRLEVRDGRLRLVELGRQRETRIL